MRDAIARLIREHHRTRVRYDQPSKMHGKIYHSGDGVAADAILALVGSGWQGIGSAPRGEMLLLFEPHDEVGFSFVGYGDSDGKWRNNLDPVEQFPTHWRRLPAPPATREGAAS